MFSLESPHREATVMSITRYTIININTKITLYYPQTAGMGIFPRVETAVVNKSSVLEPLKFNYSKKQDIGRIIIAFGIGAGI